MKMRNKLRFAAAAAVLVVAIVFAASAFEPMGDITLSQGATDKAVQPTPMDAVSPTPTPEAFEQPKPTPTPIPEKETYVYATERGIWYHSDSACSDMQNPRYIPVYQAITELLDPCPKCIADTDHVEITVRFPDNVWMTEYGLYYHMEPDCSGMQNAKLVERSYAEQKGKSPCPMCSVQKIAVPSQADVFKRLKALMPGALECYIGMYDFDELYISAVAHEYWTLTIGCADGPLVEISADENGPTVSFYFGVNPDIKPRLYETLEEKRISEYEQTVYEKIAKLDEEGADGYTLISVCAGFTEDDELYKLEYTFDAADRRIQAECDAETGEIYTLLMTSLG